MTWLKPTQRVLHDDLVRAEHTVGRSTDAAMRWYLTQITAEALNTQTALVAAAAPRNGLTLGEAQGWWTRAVDERVLESIETVWRNGWRVTSDGDIIGTSGDEFATFMGKVKDRLVRGLTPSLPEDAFGTVRHVITTGAALGWDTKQTAARIAKELAWEHNGPYWRRELAAINQQIDSILDPHGTPGAAAREHARLNDPRVTALQTDRAHVVKALDREASHWATRANLIATTESAGAYNFGAWTALVHERVGCKEWLATHDARTRLTHALAAGQVVPVRQPFIVGGYKMMMPGAPSAPPEEVCRCRCAVVGAECAGMAAQAPKPADRFEQPRPEWFGTDDQELVKRVAAEGDKVREAAYDRLVASGGDKDEDAAGWNSYMHGGYESINHYYRNGTKPDAKGLETIAQMDRFFGKHHSTLNEPTLLRREVTDDGGWDPVEVYKEGATVVEPGYSSTATYAGRSLAWKLNISAGRGTKVLVGNPGEYEFILDRGTAFKVVKVNAERRTVWLEVVG